MKHLTAENVMVNDLSKRPVLNMPIAQVPTWHMLLHSCTFGVNFEKLFHELHSITILT